MAIIRILTVFVLLVYSLLAPTVAEAFDGNRKGLVFGAGMVLAFNVSWSRSFGDFVETKQGVLASIFIGHGFSSKDLLVFGVAGTSFTSEFVLNARAIQSIYGLQWIHYLKRGNRQRIFYTSLGVGMMVFSSIKIPTGRKGIGFNSEFGIELKKHFQIGVYGIFGWTGNDTTSTEHRQTGFLFRVLAY